MDSFLSKRAAPPNFSGGAVSKKRRLAEIEEALEMIKSKVAYRALTEENRDVIDAKPADWTRNYQERLECLAKATAAFNYHFRFGIVEDKWYPLTQLISINKGKTFFFPENTYEVHALKGRFRSHLRKGNSNWGAGKGEDIQVRCIDDGPETFRKTHLILAAVWPDKPVDNVDHVDADHLHNNSVLNLDNVTNSMNATRKNLSAKGAAAAKKAGTSNSKKICLLNEDGSCRQVFKSVTEAAIFAVKPEQEGGLGLDYKNCRSAAGEIGKVARGERETVQGFRWAHYCTKPTRTPDSAKAALENHGIVLALALFPPLEIRKFEDLPLSRRRLMVNWVVSRKKANIPKAVTNYGEVFTNMSQWTTGSLTDDRTSLVAKTVCSKRVHAWVMLFFHESDDDVVKWMNGDWDILHMDGDKTNPATYHPYTHEDGGDAAPYTNAFFTLRFGTREDNMQDEAAKKKRRKND
mgnify:CR=1 FL=1